MDQKIVAYVSLGSNCENAAQMLLLARQCITTLPDLTVLATSAIYSTQPQDYIDQPWFLNQVLKLGLSPFWKPQPFVKALLELEAVMGRVRNPALRFGPRSIDLDLLLFGNESCAHSACTLPHPRLLKRAFVLVPLLEISPNLHIDGRSLADTLNALNHKVCGNKIFQ